LSSTQIARRWRDCNRNDGSVFTETGQENVWRTSNLELLSNAHTLGGILDLTFEHVDSRYGDLAFELECDAFKWRWETIFIGYKFSAEILSKHLIMPLVSVNYLAFSSADPVCELSERDLETAVDKVGRTARRTLDTHIKHAISKPRVSTTLQRMTAMLNFVSDLPPIISTAEKVEHQVQIQSQVRGPSANIITSRPISPHPIPRSPDIPSTMPASNFLPPNHADSATESDNEGGSSILDHTKAKGKAPLHPRSPDLSPKPFVPSPIPSRQISPLPVAPLGLSAKGPSSDSESSPPRPAKKGKRVSSSDDDSEEERKKRVAQIKAGAAKRGTRQPIKRGGKRF